MLGHRINALFFAFFGIGIKENAFYDPMTERNKFSSYVEKHILQIETQKVHVYYASFLSQDLLNIFRELEIFYFGLGVIKKCCVFYHE